MCECKRNHGIPYQCIAQGPIELKDASNEPTLEDIRRDADCVEATLVNHNGVPTCEDTARGKFGVVIFPSLDFGQTLRYQLRFRYYHRHLLPEYFSNTLAYQWGTKFALPSALDLSTLKFENQTDGGLPAYWREMFLSLQRAMDIVLTEKVSPKAVQQPDLYLQRFPYPAHQKNPFYNIAPSLIPLMLLFSFMLTVLYITRSISTVREKELWSYLSVSGLRPLSFWTATFAMNGLKMMIPVVVLSVVLQQIFVSSSFFLIFMFVLLYALNALCFAFAVSSFLHRATIATVTAAVLWFVQYLPSLYLEKIYYSFSDASKLASCLLLNTATTYGVKILSSMESQGVGLTLDNVWTTYDGISYGGCCVSMMLSSIILLIVCILCQIPATFLFWRRSVSTEVYQPKLMFSAFGEHKEKTELYKVQVRNLSVVLSPGSLVTVAVKGVSFDAHDKKSTVLLGKNGSGKTTVMSVLAGLIQAAEGTATMGPYDVHKHRNALRNLVGYCPQTNPLFDHLTVKEHIMFFAKLRNTDGFSMGHMGNLLHSLNLWDKRYSQARHLSGGMKRKLSLAIALSGQPKIVLLDEPTTGLDPAVRKEVQHMLLQEKRQRLVLLSTHYLEEADILGDQVIIMNKGKLLDKGSSRTLKKKYGEFLTIFVSFDDGEIEACAKEVYALVKAYSQNFFNVELDGRYMNIKLKTNQVTWEKLSRLMDELNRSKKLLKISRMKVTITSLEDVFQQNIELARREQLEGHSYTESTESYTFKSNDRISSWRLFFLQFWALLHKKLLVTWRQHLVLLIQLLIPIAATGLGMFVNKINRRYAPEAPALNLGDFSPYKGSKAFIQSPLNASDFQEKMIDKLKKSLESFGIEFISKNIQTPLTDILMDESKSEGISKFMNSHYFSASFNTSSLTLLFNNIAPHGIATITNAASNAILKSTMGDSYEIRTENYPLPPEILIFFQFGEEFVLSLCLSLGMLLFLSIFTVYPTLDRVTGAKHLEKLSGVKNIPYWFPIILCDLVLCAIICLATVLLLWLGNTTFLADELSWHHALMLLMAHAWAVLPLSYIGSMAFTGSAEGIAKLIMLNFLLSVVPSCLSATLMSMSFDKDQAHLKDMEQTSSAYLTVFVPQFAFTRAIMTYYSNRLMIDQCQRLNRTCTDIGSFSITNEYLQWSSPGIGQPLICLLVQGALFFALLLCFEPIVSAAKRIRKKDYGAQSLFQKNSNGEHPSLELLDFSIKYDNQKGIFLKLRNANVSDLENSLRS